MVLCDFDGTITTNDLAELVLDKFAQGDWKAIDAKFEQGKISLEECLKKEFALVKASKEQMLFAVEEEVAFRPGLEKLAFYCKEKNVPLIIVSAGIDFIINHLLKRQKWEELVETYMPHVTVTEEGMNFTFPKILQDGSVNFKHDLVRQYKSKDVRVVYIGDGTGDFAAAREADIAFAIKGSKLENLCQKYNVPCKSIVDFRIVLDTIHEMIVSYQKRVSGFSE